MKAKASTWYHHLVRESWLKRNIIGRVILVFKCMFSLYFLIQTIVNLNIWFHAEDDTIYKDVISLNGLGTETLAITNNGQYIAFDYNEYIYIYEWQEQPSVIWAALKTGPYAEILFSNKGSYLISAFGSDSDSTVVQIWDFLNNQDEPMITCSISDTIDHWSISYDDQYLISAGTSYISVWNFSNALENKNLTLIKNHYPEFEPNSFYYCGYSTCPEIFSSVAISENSQFIVAGSWVSGNLYLWDWRNDQNTTIYNAHGYGSVDVAIAADNCYFFSSGEDLTVKIWDLSLSQTDIPKKQLQVKLSTLGGLGIQLSPDNKYIIIGTAADGLMLWDWEKPGEVVKYLPSVPSGVSLWELISDEKYLVASVENRLQILEYIGY